MPLLTAGLLFIFVHLLCDRLTTWKIHSISQTQPNFEQRTSPEVVLSSVNEATNLTRIPYLFAWDSVWRVWLLATIRQSCSKKKEQVVMGSLGQSGLNRLWKHQNNAACTKSAFIMLTLDAIGLGKKSDSDFQYSSRDRVVEGGILLTRWQTLLLNKSFWIHACAWLTQYILLCREPWVLLALLHFSFYICPNPNPESKFLYTETIKLYMVGSVLHSVGLACPHHHHLGLPNHWITHSGSEQVTLLNCLM